MDELSEIYLEASGGKYGDQKGILAVRDHVAAEMKAKLDRAERALKRAGFQEPEWKPPLELSVQAIRDAWLDAEVVGNSWDGAKAVLDLCLSVKRSVDEKCPKCFDTGTIMMIDGPAQACDCKLFKKEISTGKAFQMEPMEPGTMTQEEAVGIVMAEVDQVEALARVLREAHAKHYGCEAGAYLIDGFIEQARAAIAHLAKRPEVSTKPVDLWAIITSIVEVRADLDGCDYVEIDRTNVSDLEVALHPWLLDPVGFELDVTAEEFARWHQDTKHDQSANYEKFDDLGENYKEDFIVAAKSSLNYLRSRISPVYECKECAKLRDDVTFWKRENVASNNKMLAARAALEGE